MIRIRIRRIADPAPGLPALLVALSMGVLVLTLLGMSADWRCFDVWLARMICGCAQ